MSTSDSRIIERLPKPYTVKAAPRKEINFHRKTQDACRTDGFGNLGIKVSKTIVIGDICVGKTSLVNRYCREIFDHEYKPTIGVDFEVERYTILDQPFNLQFWDTAGQERFKCIAAAYYRGASVVVLVFDTKDIKTLHNCRQWLEEALEENKAICPEIFLVGNKADLCKNTEIYDIEREAISVATDLNAEYWTVSAKTGDNVTELFSRIAAISFEQAVLRELESQASEEQKMGFGEAGAGIISLKKSKVKTMEEQKRAAKKWC